MCQHAPAGREGQACARRLSGGALPPLSSPCCTYTYHYCPTLPWCAGARATSNKQQAIIGALFRPHPCTKLHWLPRDPTAPPCTQAPESDYLDAALITVMQIHAPSCTGFHATQPPPPARRRLRATTWMPRSSRSCRSTCPSPRVGDDGCVVLAKSVFQVVWIRCTAIYTAIDVKTGSAVARACHIRNWSTLLVCCARLWCSRRGRCIMAARLIQSRVDHLSEPEGG